MKIAYFTETTSGAFGIAISPQRAIEIAADHNQRRLAAQMAPSLPPRMALADKLARMTGSSPCMKKARRRLRAELAALA
jgi:hypothetical protein